MEVARKEGKVHKIKIAIITKIQGRSLFINLRIWNNKIVFTRPPCLEKMYWNS